VIDYGLLISIIIAFGVPTMLARWWPVHAPDGKRVDFLDIVMVPALIGLVVGRITTLALDDPNSIGSVSDMVIIRSGVEFWPGVVAASAAVAWTARRNGYPPMAMLARLGPLAMIGYAGYEAACILRDGCFGPATPVGLRPPGLSTTMLPIGLLMAAGVIAAAVGLRRSVGRHPDEFSDTVALACAALAVAVVRAVGSVWLPHVGDGLTRQHITSIGVAAIAAAVVGGALWRARQPTISHLQRQ